MQVMSEDHLKQSPVCCARTLFLPSKCTRRVGLILQANRPAIPVSSDMSFTTRRRHSRDAHVRAHEFTLTLSSERHNKFRKRQAPCPE